MDKGEELRSIYYQNMGWDPETFKPLPETPERLDLPHLIQNL